ncbi:sugar transferase [Sinomonas susongensis]|uniref:sugar transferase n=1 Tax=Sinomonas susongensis TaxID=1324851 RepID=UPI001108C6C8|nr:sugar transferase [Sinomonas susongensis]
MSIIRDEAQPQLREANRVLEAAQRRMLVVDLLCIAWATIGAQIARFGGNEQSLDVGNQRTSYTFISLLLIVTWWLVLGTGGSREDQVLGYGPEEYRRVIKSTLWLFGAVAIISYVFQLDTARGYVAIALPLGIVSLLAGRWIVRATLVAKRQQGRGLQRVLLIGGPHTTRHLHRQLSMHPEAGYLPVAAHMPEPSSLESIQTESGPLPVIGHGKGIDDVLEAIRDSAATAVAITAGAAFDPMVLRQLGWQLAARNIGMIMAPALTDVAGPRIRTQPVAGLPLIHVTTPKLEGSKRVIKRSFDILTSVTLLALLALPMGLVALLVRLDSKGPAIFRQQRVGRAGAPFWMFKFRSMVADAEARLESLRQHNDGAGLLFKMKQDPRITRLGKVIRKYSIDELPQLLNVLRGEMSLVGPRPPLPSEVIGYDDFAHRRLLVKPGITGSWQVSGRSNLSWEDALRLDLYYVENWSLTQDLLILARTIRAVLSRAGAY